MARDWVKLHTSMLGHVGTMMLSDAAFRLWIISLMQAGQTDDDGRAGTIGQIAFYLRWTDDQLRNAVRELNGRVAIDGDVLCVRDWSEWQPKIDTTNAKRQAEFRARQAEELEALRAAANLVDLVERDVTPLRNACRNTPTRAHENSELRTQNTEEPENVVVESTDSQVPAGARAPAPNRNGHKTPPPHVSHPELWAGLCSWLQVAVDVKALGTPMAANIRKLAKLYIAADEGADEVGADAKAWHRDDWRGKQGQRPSVAQATEWRAHCRAEPRAPMEAKRIWTIVPPEEMAAYEASQPRVSDEENRRLCAEMRAAEAAAEAARKKAEWDALTDDF